MKNVGKQMGGGTKTGGHLGPPQLHKSPYFTRVIAPNVVGSAYVRVEEVDNMAF